MKNTIVLRAALGLATVGILNSAAEPVHACFGVQLSDVSGSPDSFVFEWTTEEKEPLARLGLPGIAPGIPAELKFDFEVDWGDGSDPVRISSEDDLESIAAAAVHEYLDSGKHTVVIDGHLEGMTFASNANLKRVLNLGNVGWTYMGGMFKDCYRLTTVLGGDVSKVTDMSQMFDDAIRVKPDTRNWDVSSVTTMRAMFDGAESANPNTSGWDVSKVEDMSLMFNDTLVANPDTRNWDVSSVTNMRGMFWDAERANPNTSGWDVSQVTDMSYMFAEAERAKPDTSGWDVSRVKDIREMFTVTDKSHPDTSRWQLAPGVKGELPFW